MNWVTLDPNQHEDWHVGLESEAKQAGNAEAYRSGGQLPLESRSLRLVSGATPFQPQPVLAPFARSDMLRVYRAVTHNEFRLGYQPCVDVRTGKVSHLEALLRWPNKPPSMNIQDLVIALEGNGLIVPVGEWVVRQACRDLATLRSDGFRALSISINVSQSQIGDANLAGLIAESLSVHRIPGRRLMLELTETMLPNFAAASTLVSTMREIGVRTMIDDFGMGFASLTLLNKVPAAAIKIDRSYTADVTRDRRTGLVTEGVIQMANNLAIDVIAEGVETESQVRWMSGRGVRKLQGFYYSPAVSLEDIRGLLQVQPWTLPPPDSVLSA